MLPTLTDMSIPAAFFVVTSQVGDPRRADALSWSSCQQLADQRMTVGSHTVTHRALADLDERAARSSCVTLSASSKTASGGMSRTSVRLMESLVSHTCPSAMSQ